MKFKKLFVLGMATMMVASLAGCGSSSDDPKAKGTGNAGGGDKTITFWNIGCENPDATIMKAAVDKFNKENKDGYNVEMTAIQNDKYKEKLVIAMSSGECPDMYTSWTGGPLQEYIDSGYAQPITKFYKDAGLDKKYMDAATQQATFKDEIYAVPVINLAISGVFYNKDIFSKNGLQEPKTIADLESVCDKLKSKGVTPFALANSTKWQGSMYYQGLATRYAGLDDFRKGFAGTGTFEADCFKYAGKKIQDWVKKGYFPEGVNSLSTDDGQDKQLLYQGKAAMFYSGSWYAGTFKADSEEFYKKLAWFPFPQCQDSKDAAKYANICNGTIGDQFISFSCKGDKLKAAFDCAANYSSDEVIDMMVSNGKIPPIKGIDKKLTDPVLLKICNYAQNSTDVQLWYDQYLPSAVANAHLDTLQEVFGLSKTPEKACQETQKAMKDYLADKKNK